MTREQAKTILDNAHLHEVLAAYSEGKPIQYLMEDGRWSNIVGPPCDDGPCLHTLAKKPKQYRVKPEPRRFWILAFGKGATYKAVSATHFEPCKLIVRETAPNPDEAADYIEVSEVQS